MFTLYHIEGKKWGMTEQKLERRLWQQNLKIDDVSNVITCGNLDMAADMERDLNIRDGYGWNESRDYRNVIKWRRCSWTAEDALRGAIKGGQTAVLSGQLQSICSMGGKVGGKIAGRLQSQKEYICPTCNRKGRGNRFVSHIKNCTI